MSFLDNLREARQSPAAAYQQFALQYPKTSNDVHAFLEGRDDPSFYFSFLLRAVSDINKIHVYRCSNKKGVYDAYAKVMRLVRKPSFVLFFVDKDHSDLIGEVYDTATNIYVTEYYSIENYLVSDSMFRRIWEDFFNAIQLKVDFDTISTKFQDELAQFYKFALPLSAWIILNRRKGMKPNVNNVKLGELCKFSEDLTLQAQPLTELISHLENVCGINCIDDVKSELSQVINELVNIEPKKYIRGKYELWFFIKFIEKMVLVLQSTTGESIKIRTQIGEANAVEILAPRVQMPKSIEKFLQQNGLLS